MTQTIPTPMDEAPQRPSIDPAVLEIVRTATRHIAAAYLELPPTMPLAVIRKHHPQLKDIEDKLDAFMWANDLSKVTDQCRAYYLAWKKIITQCKGAGS